MATLRSRHRLVRTTEMRPRRRTDTNTLIPDIIRHSDLDLGQILLHLLLHRFLHKNPTLALKLAMSSVDDAQDAFAQRLLDLSNEAADLVDQLGLDIVAETTVC